MLKQNPNKKSHFQKIVYIPKLYKPNPKIVITVTIKKQKKLKINLFIMLNIDVYIFLKRHCKNNTKFLNKKVK